MFYLVDFEYKNLEDNEKYKRKLKEDKELRTRIINAKTGVPKSRKHKKLIKRIETLNKAKNLRVYKTNKYGEIDKQYIPKKVGKGIRNRKNYLLNREITNRTNLNNAEDKLSNEEAKYQNKVEGKLSDPKKVIRNLEITKDVETAPEKIKKVITVKATTNQIPEASKVIIPNPKVSKVNEKVKEVITEPKKGLGLGKKAVIGTLGLGALAYGINRLRKTREDKGKKRGKYRK